MHGPDYNNGPHPELKHPIPMHKRVGFLKPLVTREAARILGFDFQYTSRPNWNTYANLLEFAARVRRDQRRLKPRDMIDVQSFIWVQGSDEYR